MLCSDAHYARDALPEDGYIYSTVVYTWYIVLICTSMKVKVVLRTMEGVPMPQRAGSRNCTRADQSPEK